MRRRLAQIEQRLQRIRQRMGKDQMQQDIERFHMTGHLPIREPALSFALLMESFQRLADCSVGGGDYDAARVKYGEAVKRWQAAEKGVAWTA